MNTESVLVFLLGVVTGLFLVLMIVPEHRKNCDNFGATNFGQAVYACTPKNPDKR